MVDNPNLPIGREAGTIAASQSARWIWRALIAVPIALLLSWLALSVTVAQIARFDNPSLALKFAPYDATANAVAADRILQGGRGRSEKSTMTDLAKRSLERSPLMPQAMRVLGFAADFDQQRTLARSRITYAEKLSRRDIAAQLWLIDDAVSREDVPAALNHFDTAMRTSQIARQILFPVLGQALADREYIDPVARLFVQRPNWMKDFVITTLQKGLATDNLAILFGSQLDSDAKRDSEIAQALVMQLIGEQKFAQLSQFAESKFAKRLRIVPGRNGLSVKDFSSESEFPGPLTWNFEQGAGLGADTKEKNLDVYADSAAEGSVLSRLVFISPGRHRLITSGTRSGTGGGVDWEMRCAAEPDRVLGVLTIPDRPGRVSTMLDVPTGCAAQWLRLRVRPTEDPRGLTGRITELAIVSEAGEPTLGGGQ